MSFIEIGSITEPVPDDHYKYVQLSQCVRPAGIAYQVCWVFYANEASLPPYKTLTSLSNGFPAEKCFNLLVPSDATVSAGDLLGHDGLFYADNMENWRVLFSEHAVSSWVRQERDRLLAACDKLVTRHVTQLSLPGQTPSLSAEDYVLLLSYMQELRDLPANINLATLAFPAKPAFVIA